MKTTIKDILNDMIITLEELNNEKIVLKNRYRKYYEEQIKDKSPEDIDFYSSLIDSVEDYISIDDFEPNDMMKYLYSQNLEKINELERYGLKMYKLYTEETNEKIPYLEEVKNKNIEKIQIANQKDNISVNEFELLYGYSTTAQKGFRTRLNDPIPFIQKSFNSKILYKKDKVEKWLEGKKR
jgi:hypothetical protein